MKKFLSISLAIVLLAALALSASASIHTEDKTVTEPGLYTKEIKDVNDTDWYVEFVRNVYRENLFFGTANNYFSPNQAMTRAMFVAVLGRMYQVDTAKYAKASFADVKTTQYYAPYVAWAVENHIVKGTSAKTFSPNEPVTREQAVCMLTRLGKAFHLEYKALDKDEPQFQDIASTSAEFQSSYKTLYAAAIIVGKSATKFDPSGNLSRAEAAKIFTLTNAMLIQPDVAYCVDAEIVFTIPSYWQHRHSMFSYNHGISAESRDGLPGEPGVYGIRLWETENHAKSKDMGLLFCIYMVKENDPDISLFKDANGNWLPGCEKLYTVEYKGLPMSVILEKPANLQYDANNPALKKAYLRLEQDIDDVLKTLKFRWDVNVVESK